MPALAVQPRHRLEPPQLTDDMTVVDLIDVLEHLPLVRQRRCLVEIDRGVRDFLVRALART